MKRLFVLLLILCMGLGLCACGDAVEPPARESAEPEPTVTVEMPADAPEAEDPVPDDSAITPVLEPARDYSAWWGGKWYGWAVFTQAKGRFQEQQDDSWDVVAQIDVDGSEGRIRIFDPAYTSNLQAVRDWQA